MRSILRAKKENLAFIEFIRKIFTTTMSERKDFFTAIVLEKLINNRTNMEYCNYIRRSMNVKPEASTLRPM